MKELERYLGAIYSDSFQPTLMTKTPMAFPGPYMLTTVTYTLVDHPKTDS